MTGILDEKRFIILTGNYGSGKTELALNLAFRFAESRSTTLVDLDIVNPYFRSSEKTEQLEAVGIRVLKPTFALTTVDIPALPAEIQSVFETPCDKVIFDVGGDDTGAAALGRYAPSFRRFAQDTVCALVVNCMRPLTETAEDITDLAQRISARGRVPVEILINNTNLGGKTTPDLSAKGHEIVSKAAEALKIGCVLDAGMEGMAAGTEYLKIRRMMVPDWMEEV
ncbi:MAG: ParA family protein [Clostridia bacterium]|nr:ParA family protein [Clostridia bacterium]